MALTAQQRQETVSYITANCACYKGEEKTLNGMSDDGLVKLKTHVEETSAVAEAVRNAFGPDLALNAMPAALAKAKEKAAAAEEGEEEEEEEEGEEEEMPKKPVGNSLKQWEASMPVEARAIWNAAKMAVEQTKAAMVAQLTANIADPVAKAKAVAVYNAMGPESLRPLVEAIPAATPSVPAYGGAGTTTNGTVQVQSVDRKAVLKVPTINWAEERKNKRA